VQLVKQVARKTADSAGDGTTTATPTEQRYVGPLFHGGPPTDVIDYAAMRAKYGREGVGDQLSQHRFIKKGDPSTVWVW
jgi:hypothetical protein